MDEPRKRAGRPRKGAGAKQLANTTASPAATVPEKRRRGRPSIKAAGDAAAGAVTKEKRRPGRPRKSDVSTAGGMVEDRPAAASSPASAPASAGMKRKRGRPKGATARTSTAATTVADEADEADETGEASTRQAKRRRKSVQAQQAQKADRRSEHEHEHKHASGDSDESDDDSARPGNDDALPSYGQLVPRMHMVSMATMKRKWAPLERDAVAAVQALLADCARPVLARLRAGGGAASEQRQEQARQAIAGVTRRLRSKLVKGIPFPPPTVATGGGALKKRRASVAAAEDGTAGGSDSGVAADFNFERAVDGIQALERQLTPLQHAVALLGREQAREEEALEADYAALRKLQTNAHAESRTWRERARRSHPLLPDDEGDDYDDDVDDEDGDRELSLELVKRPATPEAEDVAFEDLDKDMVAVATQLGSHLESLRGNLQQIEGVVPAMARSQAALLQVLRTHLEPQQFEQILLG